MARGDKDYNKKVRQVKGKSAKTKISAVHKMVEAIITDDIEAAQETLGKAIQQKFRRIVMGEGVIELEIDGEEGEYDDEPCAECGETDCGCAGGEEIEYDGEDDEREYDFDVDGSPDESMDDLGDDDEDELRI